MNPGVLNQWTRGIYWQKNIINTTLLQVNWSFASTVLPSTPLPFVLAVQTFSQLLPLTTEDDRPKDFPFSFSSVSHYYSTDPAITTDLWRPRTTLLATTLHSTDTSGQTVLIRVDERLLVTERSDSHDERLLTTAVLARTTVLHQVNQTEPRVWILQPNSCNFTQLYSPTKQL